MKLAQEALDRFKKPDRDMSTMTVGVSEFALHAIQQILAETRKRISEIAAQDTDSDRVYQLNIQLFPFSKPLPVQKKGE
jgi:uncharacterized protein (TIGR02147 family)